MVIREKVQPLMPYYQHSRCGRILIRILLSGQIADELNVYVLGGRSQKFIPNGSARVDESCFIAEIML